MLNKKVNRNSEKWVVADFETTTLHFYLDNGFTKVWLYAISDKDGNILNYGETIEDFFKFIKSALNTYTIYFHNLKFDGSYIINYLYNHGYEYKEKIASKDKKCFNTLISEEGQYYQINIHASNFDVKIGDSLKLLPFSVRIIGESFDLPVKKGIIDYDDYSVTDETLEYVFNDVKVVALALKEIKALGMTNMTTASCAFNNFKDNSMFFNSYFPTLETDYLEKYRDAYRGGRTQVNPLHAGQVLYNVKRFDINSMYPHIMRNLPLPVGNPIPIDRIGQYDFELYEIEVEFKLKAGHLPTLLNKNAGYFEYSYYEETDGLETIRISNIDYQLLLKHYDIICINFIEAWGFKTMTGLFKSYIDKWYKIKQENKGAKRVVAKLMLNSLYGKFGSRCLGKSKIPVLDEDGVLTYKTTDMQEMKHYYLPLAIGVVSWAHYLIDDAITKTGFDNFVYCDTDSVHTLGTLPDDYIDQSLLGKFKMEGTELKSKYIRQKTYCYCEYEKNGDIVYNITCAGMNDATKEFLLDNYKDTIFDIFAEGLRVEGYKLMPQQVKGGVILVPTTFEIKEKKIIDKEKLKDE